MAVANISAAVAPVQTVYLSCRPQLTATVAALFKWRAAQGGRILGVSAEMRAKGGTHATTTLTIKRGADTVGTIDLAALAAGTRAEVASPANTKIANGDEITVDLTVTGGTSPTIDDLRVQVDYIAQDAGA